MDRQTGNTQHICTAAFRKWLTGNDATMIYAMAARGEIEVLPVGRLRKVITAPLRRKLKLESAA
jgi:hypothetical protein